MTDYIGEIVQWYQGARGTIYWRVLYHADKDEEDLNLFEVINALEPVADGPTSVCTRTVQLRPTKSRKPGKCTTSNSKTHSEDNNDSLIPMAVVTAVSHSSDDMDTLDFTAVSEGKTVEVSLDMTKTECSENPVKVVFDFDDPSGVALLLQGRPIKPGLPRLFE